MTKIALTAGAILIGMGSAFAGSDNYGSAKATQPAPSIDASFTGSIKNSEAAVRAPVVQGADRDLFGNR